MRDFPYNNNFFLVYSKPYYGIYKDGQEVGRVNEKDFDFHSFIPGFSLFNSQEDRLLKELQHAVVRTIYEKVVKPNKTYETKVEDFSVRVNSTYSFYGHPKQKTSEENKQRTELVEMPTRVLCIARENKFLNCKSVRRRFHYTEECTYHQLHFELALKKINTTLLDHSQSIYSNGDIIHLYKDAPVISDKFGRYEWRYVIAKVYSPSSNTYYYTTFNPWDLKREIKGLYKEEGGHRYTIYPDGTAVDICKNAETADDIFCILTKNRTRDCKICISKTRLALCRIVEIHDYRNAYIYTYDLC